ncbi:hypothetical protein LIER_27823 [Lithospermum erythrorhizon]|uniref:Uncharacterized protein n=1 Tax=Lithospermum erythrorhizon TaxID=34254 RepID=A0AAV3RGW3_LITER
MAAQYTPLVDPYAAWAQSMKHITQAQKVKLEEETQRVKELTEERAQERDAAKAWSAKKTQLEDERDNLQKRAEAALLFAAAKAETDRIHFANSTVRSFISSPAHEKKMGSECAASLYSLVSSTSRRFPDLIALFNEEMTQRLDWYRGWTLPLPKGAFLLEEGGETPNLPVEEDHLANP